jgi:hypothetical protein
MSTQGAGLLAAGYLATFVAPRTAVAVVAAATLLLAVPLLGAQGMSYGSRKGQE